MMCMFCLKDIPATLENPAELIFTKDNFYTRCPHCDSLLKIIGRSCGCNCKTHV